MWGTTPPCEMTTSPRSLFNLRDKVESADSPSGRETEENALFVVPDSKLQVTGHNTLLLVIPSGITGQLKDLGSEVLENSS